MSHHFIKQQHGNHDQSRGPSFQASAAKSARCLSDSCLIEEAGVPGHQGCSVVDRCEFNTLPLALMESEKYKVSSECPFYLV